jgi:hypothetical protein
MIEVVGIRDFDSFLVYFIFEAMHESPRKPYHPYQPYPTPGKKTLRRK